MTIRFTGTRYTELRHAGDRESSGAVRGRVLAARVCAAELGRRAPNARIPDGELRESLRLAPDCHPLLERSVDQLGTTARGMNRILRVARSIADLAGSADVQKEHVAEAIQLRV